MGWSIDKIKKKKSQEHLLYCGRQQYMLNILPQAHMLQTCEEFSFIPEALQDYGLTSSSCRNSEEKWCSHCDRYFNHRKFNHSEAYLDGGRQVLCDNLGCIYPPNEIN